MNDLLHKRRTGSRHAGNEDGQLRINRCARQHPQICSREDLDEILDPSRKGCHPDVIEAVGRLAPDRVVLVSCDVESMARDLAALVDGPFVLEEIQPVDMFPQTRHIENVSFLRLEG